ncbi:unnamed protein product [Kuraishia capsulata CBS 1993]|uniref:Altered inheritance of mitochondria protein 24, mitochondrial n=1 Tax=Kuraishia capsulata CBS 1993 TaxID=1382522 RepID=W6MJK0_9ASCO|nr:uncharacterized protein KUCA_T00002129001 [Kuraishia capsulata CBS 1993]CDK26158.1 unnamed protein product [Kuraishia capsulata CBS 1993]
MTRIFNRGSTRQISFQSLKGLFGGSSTSSNISKPVTSLPKVTGLGPFSEKPKFEPIGTPANLLNIKLPTSSILNLRLDTNQHKTLAITGDVSSLVVELGKLSNSNKLIYQRCFNPSNPLSILLSSKSGNGNFLVLESNDTTSWGLVDSSSLIGWTGNHVDIEPLSLENSILGSSRGIHVKGQDGAIAISTMGQVLQLKLESEETIQLAPSSVVAYSISEAGTEPVFSELTIPSLGVGSIDLLTKTRAGWEQLKSFTSTRILSPLNSKLKIPPLSVSIPWLAQINFGAVKKVWRYLGGALLRLTPLGRSSENRVVEIAGPRTVLVTNYMVGNSGARLSRKEIEAVI